MTDAPLGDRPVADGGSEPPVVRDKRRVDPETGQVRSPGEWFCRKRYSNLT